MRTSRLYHQLQTLLGQSVPWADQRHLQTLIWMMIGLMCSECINLTKWRVYICSRAVFAQSHQRRFSRWLHNPRINVRSSLQCFNCTSHSSLGRIQDHVD